MATEVTVVSQLDYEQEIAKAADHFLAAIFEQDATRHSTLSAGSSRHLVAAVRLRTGDTGNLINAAAVDAAKLDVLALVRQRFQKAVAANIALVCSATTDAEAANAINDILASASPFKH
jgi:hypothetical protein